MKNEINQLLSGLTKIVFGAIGLYWCLHNYQLVTGVASYIIGLSFPFLMGAAMAFLLNIPLRAIERNLMRATGKNNLRGVSILLTLLAVIAVLLTVVLIVVPQIGVTLTSLKVEINSFIANTKTFEMNLSTGLPEIAEMLDSIGLTWENISSTVTAFVSSFGGKALNISISFATSVFSGIVNFLLAFVFAIYLLSGKEWLGKQFYSALKAYTPAPFVQRFKAIQQLVDKIFSAFFAGQCLEACILGSMFFIGMTIFRFPYALLVSVLIGFTALIPIVGAFIGCIVGTFLILVVNPIQSVWFVLFFLVMQQIENNLIYPRVVGGSVGLPAIWVLVAVTIGGSLLGVVGMLVFIPLVSVIYTLINEDVERKLKKKSNKTAKS